SRQPSTVRHATPDLPHRLRCCVLPFPLWLRRAERPGNCGAEVNNRRASSVVVGMCSSRVEDERLLRALYASHARPLLAYVQRLLGGDRQRAEDIVQETLLRAWQHADDLTVEQARPWLFTVESTLVM